MKAAVLREQGVIAFTEVPEPSPVGDRSVLLRIGAVGVCGSDVLRYGRGKAYRYPLVLGHEFSGIVEEAPDGGRFSPGDRVAVFPLLADPDDPFTRIGELALGRGYDYYGSRRDGAMSERLHVPEANLIPVPPDMPLVHAAMVEPAAVALHAVLKCDVPASGTALVIGAGPIGALAAQWLRLLGWTRVLVAEVDPRKREVMAALGFEVVDASGDTVAAVRDLTGGHGVDCAVEASGLPLTLVQALEAVAPLGTVIMLGDLSGDVTLPQPLVSSLLRREVRILGTWNSKITPAGRSEWEMVVTCLGRGLEVAPLISHTPSLADADAVFDDLVNRRVWYNKVVFAVADEARAELDLPGVAPAADRAATWPGNGARRSGEPLGARP
ncbi:galactitol-1-phosphate 5-dehydrogenase [Actinomadura rubrobrunea]|uniref:Galactitol-1-phosphate 5-dehydrogenase n=1 Tax=Actinomadura rubrobrunea TaxID=115335 RepID=A0A9W6PNT0_9ACTN|nr:galactitol-1-phosphate 5-dehydrogenase [Actinomadura rubrobrunea]GLW61904.1 galactitol-1-phosphate 5-dehydrogenase [Actinomadura rubrobrunea]